MKKLLFFISIILLPAISESRNLYAFLTYATFNSPEGPYIETYLSVAGNSVKYIKKDNGKFQAMVNILMTFRQNNDIKAFKKYELKSPEIEDTAKTNFEFIDEQRFQLASGAYEFELQLADKNKNIKPAPYSQNITIDFPSEKPSVSGIQLLKSYSKSETSTIVTKNGYDLIPYVYNFYPENEKKLTFYCELYNTDKELPEGQKYVLIYYIESNESHLKLFEYSRVKKEIVKPVNVLMAEFNVANLATGNYNLVVEARDQKNDVMASQKVFFQRRNPNATLTFNDLLNENSGNTFADKITNPDSLKEFISSTFPISGGMERAFIKDVMKTSTLPSLQQYFYGFWVRRDAANPEKAWLAYKQQVKIANYNFHTPVKKGYQTDRGRVFLEYGPPNTRAERPSEPTSYPYEIWQYYTLNTQRNKKFVFYSPDMVTNDYFLLHSDATGEIYNAQWQVELQKRTYSPVDMNETQTINSWGEMSKDYWDLPN